LSPAHKPHHIQSNDGTLFVALCDHVCACAASRSWALSL
jgi:hypothetical protein